MLSFSPPDAAQNIQTMRLRDDPPPIAQPQRPAKKRKTPPTAEPQPQQQPQQPQQQQQHQQMQHVLPPMMHSLPPGYPYAPADYTPGGMPPAGIPHPGVQLQEPPSQSPPPSASQRALSSTKRAEQNRKAQRAFRERRDQHVKALESRSSLLDAALASADEANRRWEECRALVDQLRVENAALRATLNQVQHLAPNLAPQEEHKPQDQHQQQRTEPPRNDTDGPADQPA